MKKLTLTLFIAIFALAAAAQQAIPDFKANIFYTNAIDTVLRRNYKDYDLIIAFRTFTKKTLETEYHILVCNKGKWQKQIFRDKRTRNYDMAPDAFVPMPVNDSQCESLFKSLVDNHLFNIEDDKINPCCTERDTVIKGVRRTYSFGINDGKQVQLWLVTPKKSRHLYFYAPDFYVNYCQPYQDRRDALKIMDMLAKNW